MEDFRTLNCAAQEALDADTNLRSLGLQFRKDMSIPDREGDAMEMRVISLAKFQVFIQLNYDSQRITQEEVE